MKKFFLGFLLVIFILILALIGFFFYLKIPLAIEKVLPQGAVVYGKVSDVENNAKKFMQMPVWQAILNLNYRVLVENKIMTQEQQANLEAIKKNQEAVINHFMFKKILGQEIAIAFYMDDLDARGLEKIISGQKGESVVEKEIFSNLFFVTRLEPEAQIAESLLKTLSSSFGQDVIIEFSRYKGHSIQTFVTSDKSVRIGMTRIKDLLVLGLGDKAAKSVIDVMKNSRAPLEKDQDFLIAQQKFFQGSTLQGFIHLSRIVEKFMPQFEDMILKSAASSDGSQELMVKEMKEKINQFKMAAFSASFDETVKIKINIEQNEKKSASEDAICSLRVNESPSLIPSGALVYFWNSCFNLDYFWKQAKKELAKMAQSSGGDIPADKIKMFEQQIGVQIEQDILPAFGQEAGFYLANIDVQKSFVLPELVIFLEIQDQFKADALLNKLLGKSFLPVQEDFYEGISVHYMETPLANISPAYCYLGKYLLIAINKDLLKSSIDLYTKKTGSLATKNKGQFLDSDFMGQSVLNLFFRVNAISHKLKDIVGFVNVLADAQDNKIRAFQSGSQKRIEDVKKHITDNQLLIIDLQKQQDILKDKIWDLDAAKLESQLEQGQMKVLEDKIQQLTLEMESDEKIIKDIEKGLLGYAKALEESAIQKIYVQEAVYPVLNSFSFMEFFSVHQNNKGRDLEVNLLIKTQK